jgi:YihY family inner membrane protein
MQFSTDPLHQDRRLQQVLKQPGRFFLRVLSEFRRNQGLLLSGAVAYHMLLSIVPLIALLLVGLSHFMEEEALMATVRSHIAFVVPAEADALTGQITSFLEHRELIGWVGILVLVFFSTLAFTVLENAMSVIFFHRVNIHRRHFLISALIPFLFIFMVGIGILLITFVSGAIQALNGEQVEAFGMTWGLSDASGSMLYLLGDVGLVALMTSFYLIMPVGRISLRHAFVGGLTAALLWEGARHLLVWYFSTLSFVNVVYGSLASTIVVLLSFELAALILLFGAQVIAVFERGLPDSEETSAGFQT